MKIKAIRQSIVLHFFLIVAFTSVTAPMAMSEMIFNDNVNIEGELFLNGENTGVTFSDGTRQSTAATCYPWDKYILFAIFCRLAYFSDPSTVYALSVCGDSPPHGC